MNRSEDIKKALVAGTGAAALAALLTLVVDPTAGPAARLDGLKVTGVPAERSARHAPVDTAGLANTPLFVMTSGPGAYKDHDLHVFGISISPKRKAALVGIDGGEPAWMTVGQNNGDLRLSDVGTNGVNFDTPVGPRTVALSDAPASKTATGDKQ